MFCGNNIFNKRQVLASGLKVFRKTNPKLPSLRYLKLNKEEVQKIKHLIESEIEKTTESVNQYRELTQPIAPENAIGRVSRMDAINNKSVTEAALRTAEKKLRSLQNILPTVSEKDFGLCARCKKPIPIQRILLVPYSQFCVNCAS